jgi:HlyD family secretion protein
MTRETAVLCLLLATASGGCRHDDAAGVITASGHVEATEVTVSTKVSGVIESLPIEEGDVVQAGQELARLETTDTELALDSARAERELARAELRLRLAGARDEEIAEASALVSRAEADLESAEKDLARMEGLLASGSGTEKLRDDARARRDVSAATLSAARERLRKLRSGARPEEVDAARARVAAAEARIAQLDQQLADAVVKSPVAGVVTEKLVEAGELATRGTALVVVTDIRSAWLTAYVSGPDLARLRIGQAAEVITDDAQQRNGRVVFMASEAEFTPKNVQTRDERVKLVYKIKIALDNEDGLFKPGMPAEVRLEPGGPAQ